MRRRIAAVLARLAVVTTGLVLISGSARADNPTASTTPSTDDPTLRNVQHERRNGLTLGAAGGIAFAGASGYPNSARFYNDPAFYSESPLLVGYSMSYFILGALTDYFSFGPSLTIANFENDKWKSTGWGLGFRADFFPFAVIKGVPALADTALFGQLGVGTAELRAKGPYPSTDGTQSFFGIGLHHEFRLTTLLGGHAAMGPQIEYDAIRSQSHERHWLWAGLRIVWYGGSVKLDNPAPPPPSAASL
jgi:hypothetical protein